MSGKSTKKFRREINKAVRANRIEIEKEIKSYINSAPFIQRIRFAGLVLAGKV